MNDATLAELEGFLAGWTVPYSHPHETRSGVTFLEARTGGGLGERGFTSAKLAPHTDRASATAPPSILATIILDKAGAAGECLIVDGKDLLAEFLHDYAASYNQLVLEADAGQSWPVIEIKNERYCQIRYRDDDIARPRASSETSDRILQIIRSFLSRPLSISLDIGDGYIAHNHRILHGRHAFTGRRRVARILATVEPESNLSWINRGFYIGPDACVKAETT